MTLAKTDTLLSAKNIGLSFIDGKKEKMILANVNLEIKDIVNIETPSNIVGQKVALVGKSGSGKSLLLRRLAGLYTHESKNTGEILIHHDRVPGKHELTPVKEGDMGIVFQNYYLPIHLSIKEMMIKSAKKNRELKGSKVINDMVNFYLEKFELSEHQNKYPNKLSGGQKQRAAIAVQFLNGSEFLLMDEPFSGLDPIMIDKTLLLLDEVSSSDELKTLIIVSHDLENCAAICDTMMILSKKGREENAGATIVANIDLIERGLAYHKDIKKMSEFHNLIEEVKNYL